MQYVTIKKEIDKESGLEKFLVPALTLKNSKGEMKQRIPHPLGDSFLEFDTLDEAIKSVQVSGFKCMLADGGEVKIRDKKIEKDKTFEEMIFDALLKQTKDMNSTVAAAALTSLGEFDTPELMDLFIDKMGEDNEAIRTSSINSLLNFGARSVKKLLSALNDENWVRRNSCLICLQRLIKSESVKVEKLITPLIEMTNDKNPIVKTSAILALGEAYKLYKKD